MSTHGYNPVTIDPKLKGTILNLFIKTGNNTDTILWSINATTTGHDLVSYRYQLEARFYRSQIKGDAISLAIDFNRKLATINAKSKGTILNLFIKTGIDCSLTVKGMEFLYQLMYLKFMCYK